MTAPLRRVRSQCESSLTPIAGNAQGTDGNGRHTRRPPNVTQSPAQITTRESAARSPDFFSTAAQDFDSGSWSRNDQEAESPMVRTRTGGQASFRAPAVDSMTAHIVTV